AQQRFGLASILRRRGPAGAGALDRSGFHPAVADMQEALGGVAEEGALRVRHKAGKGGRTGGPQRQVGLPGIAVAGGAEALGIVHLVTVAGADVLLDAQDRLTVLLGVLLGPEG